MYLRTPSRFGLRGLGDTSGVQGQIVVAANKYGVDPTLALALAQQESGYKQTGAGGGTLKSSAGALGVMQLMPATAAGLGVNPNDEAQNIDGGVRLLSQLLGQFNGDTSKALAAYNAGPGAVIKYGGIPPYPETQNYVSSIMAAYRRAGGSGAAQTIPDAGAGAGGDSSGTTGDYSYPTPTPTGFDLASYFPGTDASYDVGGVVLSGSDLWLIGAAIAGVVVLTAVL